MPGCCVGLLVTAIAAGLAVDDAGLPIGPQAPAYSGAELALSPHSAIARSAAWPLSCQTPIATTQPPPELPPTVYQITPATDRRGAANAIDAIELRSTTPAQAAATGQKLTTRHYGPGGPRNILTFITAFDQPGVFAVDVRAASVGGATMVINAGGKLYMRRWPRAQKTHQVDRVFSVPIPPGTTRTTIKVINGTVVADRYLIFPSRSLAQPYAFTRLETQMQEFQKADGYRGIWYFNQKLDNEYVYKYSGGLGTYCAKHLPFAVYAPEVNKTFFVYGGTSKNERNLLAMVSWYDHDAHRVPQPTILHDKQTSDAHDNPVISLDDDGHIWVFVSAHGTARPSFIYRSKQPYSVEAFDLIEATNFSYPQVHYSTDRGFFFFQTIYGGGRRLHFQTSPDGNQWTDPKLLAAIDEGHYQISAMHDNTVGTAFNYHPDGKGLNWRTNLYYMESPDFGETWQNVRGETVNVPLTEINNNALVHDYRAEGLNVYMKDINFDARGRPAILVITSKGYASGPQNDPRTWTLHHWMGDHWRITEVCTSDNNYDMGSLYIEGDTWRIIGPTETGPQPYNPGGEVAIWISSDNGINWRRAAALTADSDFNHTYVRRPVNAHSPLYAFWADGHGRQPSESRLYFAEKSGEHVWRLPPVMDDDHAEPQLIPPNPQ